MLRPPQLQASNPVAYLAPLLVYTLLAVDPAGLGPDWLLTRYATQVLLTTLALAVAWPAVRGLLWHVSLPVWPVAVAGGLLWIVLAAGGYEWPMLEQLAGPSLRTWVARPQFNPSETLGASPATEISFWIVRAAGLVIVVPLAEELFLRGFLTRFVSHSDWSERSVGELRPVAWPAVALYAVATHPAEPLAAVLWFSLVTAVAWKTKSFGACVAMHAVANAMLLAYIFLWQDWRLW